MSTLRVTNVQNPSAASAAITLDTNGQATLNGLAYPTSGSLSGRNRIINGDMRIDQRNAGASVTPATTAAGYPVDRFSGDCSVNSKYTLQQSSTAPVGHKYSIVATSSSAYSVAAGDYFFISQVIEGYNVADLGFGAAGASSFTLSFWVRSSLTGTFGGSFRNGAGNRSYPFTYTISSANTWEQKTVTVAGDTSGTWLTTNGAGLRVEFGLGVGSTYSGTAGSWSGNNYVSATGATSVVGTNGATFYITGVQLEAGSVATPFERRSYGQELALCQRYYERVGNEGTSYNGRMIGAVAGDGNANISLQYIVTKRATPTLTDINFQYYNGSAWVGVSTFSSDGAHSGRAVVTSEASNRLTRGQFAASAEL